MWSWPSLITPILCQRYRRIGSRTCVIVDGAPYAVLKSRVHPMAPLSASIFSNTPSLDTDGDILNIPQTEKMERISISSHVECHHI